MKVIYEAKDGTQFVTEEECREYEGRHNVLYDLSNFIAADANGDPTPSNGYDYSPDDFDYFCCFTEEAAEACEEFFRENGIPLGFKLEPNRVYHYNYEEEVWQPLSEKLRYLSYEINRLSAIEQNILSTNKT